MWWNWITDFRQKSWNLDSLLPPGQVKALILILFYLIVNTFNYTVVSSVYYSCTYSYCSYLYLIQTYLSCILALLFNGSVLHLDNTVNANAFHIMFYIDFQGFQPSTEHALRPTANLRRLHSWARFWSTFTEEQWRASRLETWQTGTVRRTGRLQSGWFKLPWRSLASIYRASVCTEPKRC